MIQSVSNVMSGFFVSFIENWKITTVMMFAAPVLGIVQGIADKVGNNEFFVWFCVVSSIFCDFAFHQMEKFVIQQKEELMKRAKGMAKKSLGSIKTVAAYAGEKVEKTRSTDISSRYNVRFFNDCDLCKINVNMYILDVACSFDKLMTYLGKSRLAASKNVTSRAFREMPAILQNF